MKKRVIFLAMSASLFGADIYQTESMYKEITQKKRVDYKTEINGIRNPFVQEIKIIRQDNPQKSAASENNTTASQYQLKAILNNSAKINDRWYKNGEEIDGYKLSKIGTTSVTLKPQHGESGQNMILELTRAQNLTIKTGAAK